MLSWLQTQANRGVLFVGFCELNGWQELESYTELSKNKPKIVFRAANAGFSYSHVMVNSQPYNIGIVSARPFVVLGEYGPPTFQRGLLHVYYPHLQLHVMIVHLHAHSSNARILEADAIQQVITAFSMSSLSAFQSPFIINLIPIFTIIITTDQPADSPHPGVQQRRWRRQVGHYGRFQHALPARSGVS